MNGHSPEIKNHPGRFSIWLFFIFLLAGCAQGLVSTPASPSPIATISHAVSPTITSPTQTPTTAAPSTPEPFPAMPLDLLIRKQPASCPGSGSDGYSEPPLDTARYLINGLASLVLERGTLLLVTNSSDEVNGDPSSALALLENPGTDGISLREALLAANNDPGEYTILFDASMQGAVIQVGSWDGIPLPPLARGSVIINGGISFGLTQSSGNRIVNLTIADNHMRINADSEGNVYDGVILSAGYGADSTGNTISSPAPGISLVGGFSRLDMPVTQENGITGIQVWCNSILEEPVLLQAVIPGVKGINLIGGYGLAQNNRISNVFLFGNDVSGVVDDISVFQNLEEGSQGNSVEFRP